MDIFVDEEILVVGREHSKNLTPVLGNAIPVLGVEPKRGR